VADEYLDLAKSLGLAIVGIALMALVLSFFAPFIQGAGGGAVDIASEPSTSSWIDTGLSEPTEGLDVAATREQAVQLDGNGYVAAPEPTLNDSWTVCSVGALTSGYNNQAHYTLLAIDNETATLRYADGNWTARYINNGTETAASAPASSPTDLTAVCGRYDNQSDTLELVVEGSVVASSVDGEQDHNRSVAINWNGTIDETRVWGRAVSDSNLTAYANDPVIALPGADRQLRVMFDEDVGGATRTHYAGGGTAGLVGGATIGEPAVQRPGISGGSDWRARTDGTYQIQAVSGGYLDGAPIVFIIGAGGPFASIITTLFSVGPAALSLLAVAVLAFAAKVVVNEFEGSGF